MNNESNNGSDLRERIVRLMMANQQVCRKQITDDERERLKTAASRLDQMLKDAADAEQHELKKAAARLDALLADIRGGKDIVTELKRK